MFCPKCGTKISDDSRFCYKCGTSIEQYLNNLSLSQNSGAIGQNVQTKVQQSVVNSSEPLTVEEQQTVEQETSNNKNIIIGVIAVLAITFFFSGIKYVFLSCAWIGLFIFGKKAIKAWQENYKANSFMYLFFAVAVFIICSVVFGHMNVK